MNGSFSNLFYKRTTSLFFLMGVFLCSGLKAQIENEVSDSSSNRHNVYLELGGAAGLYSLNYEFIHSTGLSLRMGASYLELNDGFVSQPPTLLLPIGFGRHFQVAENVNIEISGGPTIVFSREQEFDQGNKSPGIFGHLFIGLSGFYNTENNNSVCRIGFTPLFIDNHFALWGSFSIGFHF